MLCRPVLERRWLLKGGWIPLKRHGIGLSVKQTVVGQQYSSRCPDLPRGNSIRGWHHGRRSRRPGAPWASRREYPAGKGSAEGRAAALGSAGRQAHLARRIIFVRGVDVGKVEGGVGDHACRRKAVAPQQATSGHATGCAPWVYHKVILQAVVKPVRGDHCRDGRHPCAHANFDQPSRAVVRHQPREHVRSVNARGPQRLKASVKAEIRAGRVCGRAGAHANSGDLILTQNFAHIRCPQRSGEVVIHGMW
eukprot:4097396-Prymnesium_polylepis.1